jgi:hypothetical protein
MTHPPGQQAREIAELRSNVRQLQQAIRVLEDERDELISRRFRRLLIFGVGISVVVHISIMVWLAMMRTPGVPGPGAHEVNYEFAIIDEEELDQMEESAFDDLEPEQSEPAQNPEETTVLEPTTPTVDMAVAAAGSVPTLGASGEGTGGEMGLGGGGGSASFFGVGGKGQRFAFIVDISGSMANDRKFETCMRELARSIEALPDFAHFHVILFESKTVQPSIQNGWLRARKTTVRQVIRWLGEVEPNGGTEPRNAFLQVFSLETRPDVIFFLTDGIFNDISADEVAALNARGKKAMINTIGFGAPGEVDPTLLRQLAGDSGGQYRFVSTGSAP